MTNTKTKSTKIWNPNEKQTAFLSVLKDSDHAVTLAEASEIAGIDFKPGTITPLVSKGLVSTEDVSFDCLIVRADDTEKVVGRTKKTVKAYTLVSGAKDGGESEVEAAE